MFDSIKKKFRDMATKKLFRAIRYLDVKGVEFAIDHGADVNARSMLGASVDTAYAGLDGTTPLVHLFHSYDVIIHGAFATGAMEKGFAIVNELLTNGALVSKSTVLHNQDGSVIFHEPIEEAVKYFPSLAVCAQLVDSYKGNLKIFGGHNPVASYGLLSAASERQPALIRLFLDSKADPMHCDEDGNTALHKAVNIIGHQKNRHNTVFCVNDLIVAGLDVNAENKAGQTPLDLLCISCRPHVSYSYAARIEHFEAAAKLLLLSKAEFGKNSAIKNDPDVRATIDKIRSGFIKDDVHEQYVKDMGLD